MDVLHKFLFEGLAVRGMLVKLGGSWRELLSRRAAVDDGGHAFAAPVRSLIGQMTAASLLMQANIKFNGALILQLHGDGPVKLAVAEAQPDLRFRATAKVVGDVASTAELEAMLNPGGKGRCAITLDPRERLPGQQPYQGVVPLHGDRREPLQQLSQVLEHYMLQSEQLDTKLVLAANDAAAAGLLIQRLPTEGEDNLGGGGNDDELGALEHFKRVATLAGTLTAAELLALDPAQVLHRLFWDETLRVFEPKRPCFACSCSRERVVGMLKSLGQSEIEGIVAERGEVEIGCDFCGAMYRFDPVDAAELFTAGRDQPPASAQVH